jgi:hypothetical protein
MASVGVRVERPVRLGREGEGVESTYTSRVLYLVLEPRLVADEKIVELH